MKTPTVVKTLGTRPRARSGRQPAVGFFQSCDLTSPEKFLKKLPLARRYGGLTKGQEREAWEWRAHALRVGRNPLALFIWLMKHPDERRSKIAGEDERAAGKAMQRAQHAIFANRAKLTRKEAYARYLMSRRWHQLRIAKLREQKFTCEDCNKRLTRRELEVHHKRYPKVLGTESLEDLMALCAACHSLKHIDVSGWHEHKCEHLTYIGDRANANRHIKAFGETFCVGCNAWFPAGEFTWLEDDSIVGTDFGLPSRQPPDWLSSTLSQMDKSKV